MLIIISFTKYKDKKKIKTFMLYRAFEWKNDLICLRFVCISSICIKSFWAIHVHLMNHLLQKKSNWESLTTPWFLHRAHFGVLWYRSWFKFLRKNAGGKAPKTGCCDIRFVISTPLGKLILFKIATKHTTIFSRL